MVKVKNTEKSRFFYGYAIVIAGTLISIVMWGTRLSFNVLFAPVLTEFGWSRTVTAGGFSLTWVCCGLLSIWVGRMNDKIGPRIIMTVAGALLALVYLLSTALLRLLPSKILPRILSAQIRLIINVASRGEIFKPVA